MITEKQRHWAQVSATAAFISAIVITVAFVTVVDAKHGFWRDMPNHSHQAIQDAFESADYQAYVEATTALDNQKALDNRVMLTEEAFNHRVARMTLKREIHETFVDDDYEAYQQLTDGSMRQLSEAAFEKKATMIGIKGTIQDAIHNRDYDTFTAKRDELQALFSSDPLHESDRQREAISEEEFNALADKRSQFSDMTFFGQIYHHRKGSCHKKGW